MPARWSGRRQRCEHSLLHSNLGLKPPVLSLRGQHGLSMKFGGFGDTDALLPHTQTTVDKHPGCFFAPETLNKHRQMVSFKGKSSFLHQRRRECLQRQQCAQPLASLTGINNHSLGILDSTLHLPVAATR